MGQQIKIKFISSGFKEILCSGEVHDLVSQSAEQIQSRANANNTRGGDGFSADTWLGNYGGGRWVSTVSAMDRQARIAESEDKALSRAVM